MSRLTVRSLCVLTALAGSSLLTPSAQAQDAAGDPCQQAEVTSRISFNLYEGQILPEMMPMVDRLAAVLRACPEAQFELQIHTDTVRMSSFNRRQSQVIADQLRDLLVQRGIPASRLAPCGYGESQPLANVDPNWRGNRNERLVIRRLTGSASAHRCAAP